MSAAKHTDPIVGLDQHLILPPMGPPIMVPIPVAGMVLDPADYEEGACTVLINGLRRARAGNLCKLSPPHVPIGGAFAKPPTNESELSQGSSTVTADGEALSAMGHQVLGCHDVGSPAPTRPWKSASAVSLMMAGSVVLAIPAGAPVIVGGAPTTAANASVESTGPPAWVEIEVVDANGDPVIGVSYELVLGDGTVRNGTVSDRGRISLSAVDAGDYTLTLFV